MATEARATVEDLARVPGKAEVVGGRILLMASTGGGPGYVDDEILASLRESPTLRGSLMPWR